MRCRITHVTFTQLTIQTGVGVKSACSRLHVPCRSLRQVVEGLQGNLGLASLASRPELEQITKARVAELEFYLL